MKNWDAEKIVSSGMILALLITITGNIIFALMTGQYPTSDLAFARSAVLIDSSMNLGSFTAATHSYCS